MCHPGRGGFPNRSAHQQSASTLRMPSDAQIHQLSPSNTEKQDGVDSYFHSPRDRYNSAPCSPAEICTVTPCTHSNYPSRRSRWISVVGILAALRETSKTARGPHHRLKAQLSLAAQVPICDGLMSVRCLRRNSCSCSCTTNHPV